MRNILIFAILAITLFSSFKRTSFFKASGKNVPVEISLDTFLYYRLKVNELPTEVQINVTSGLDHSPIRIKQFTLALLPEEDNPSFFVIEGNQISKEITSRIKNLKPMDKLLVADLVLPGGLPYTVVKGGKWTVEY